MRSLFILTSIATVAHGNDLFHVDSEEVPRDPAITTAPEVPVELLRRQNNQRFMGWISYDGTWTSRTCDVGGTLYRSGNYWRCCATTIDNCNVPVDCTSGSLIYSFRDQSESTQTYACTDIYTDPDDSSYTVCNTGLRFSNTDDSNPQTNVFCGTSGSDFHYFQERPTESLDPSLGLTDIDVPGLPTGVFPPSSGLSSGDSNSTSESSGNGAWIAGAVIGPIIFLSIIGLVACICIKKKKAPSPPASNVTPAAAPSSLPPPYPGGPQQDYGQETQQMSTQGSSPYNTNAQDGNLNRSDSWIRPPPLSPSPTEAMSTSVQPHEIDPYSLQHQQYHAMNPVIDSKTPQDEQVNEVPSAPVPEPQHEEPRKN